MVYRLRKYRLIKNFIEAYRGRKMNIARKYTTEKILIRAFDSASALKMEIRERVRKRAESYWDVCGISTRGAFIYFEFKRREF